MAKDQQPTAATVTNITKLNAKDTTAAATDAPAPAQVLEANGAFPRGSLGKDTDNVELRSQVFDHVRKYSHASWTRSIWEALHTLAFYWLAFQYPESNIAWVLSALIRVRLFIIFHDCAHDSYFPSRKANRIGGLLFGVMNHMPLSFWEKGHNHHHRHRCVW